MKPRPFDYVRPDTVEEAVAVLAEHGDDARVLAGGQSLMAMLNLRLADPAVIVDIARMKELDAITDLGDKVEIFDYPHALVRLNFCKVFHWTGEFQMLEHQQMAWATLPVQVNPVLPGTIPVLNWFAEERGHVGPTHLD